MDKESLSISLFGAHLFRWQNRPVPLGIRGSTLQLLYYLVVQAGREIRREYIADRFWRQSSECRQSSALNSAIWRISKKLPDHPGVNLNVTDATVCLEIDERIPVDTRMLTDLVYRAACPDAMNAVLAEKLSRALDASESSFMDGLVEDWALAERERLSNIRLRGLTLLMHWYGDGRRYEDALEVGRRLLLEDPFRETVQIDMMWLYVLNGQRAQALKQYVTYADMLDRELDIEPMTETRALYDYIRCGLNCSLEPPDPTGLITPNRVAGREKLDTILVMIEQSRRDLYKALRTQLG